MAGNVQGSGDQEGDLADINVVPLVDVMLVLLVIFMVTAPLSIGGIPVALPTSKAKVGEVKEKRIIVTVNQKGEFYMDDTKFTPKALHSKLQAVFNINPDRLLYIRADRGVPYGRVVDAMSTAKLAGAKRLSMLTRTAGKVAR